MRILDKFTVWVMFPWSGRARIMVIIAVALMLMVQISPYWQPTMDGSAYLSIARSIGAGAGLERFGEVHLFFAPGYSVLIAPLTVFGLSFLAFSVAHWVFLVLFFVGTYVWARRIVPRWAMVIAILSAMNVGVMDLFRRTLSEAAFMPLLVWGAVVLDRLVGVDRENESDVPVWWIVAGIGIVAGLCVVRQAGLALPLGLAVLVVYRAMVDQHFGARVWLVSAMIVGAGLASTVGLSLFDANQAASLGGGQNYVRLLFEPDTSLMVQLFDTARLRIQSIGRLLVPGMFKAYGGWLNPAMLIYVPVTLCVAAGWVITILKCSNVLVWSFPFYIGLYLIWPYDQGTRFMVPMVPVFWIVLLMLAKRWEINRRRLRRGAAVLILLSGLTSAIYWVTDLRDAIGFDRQWAPIRAICTQVPDGERLSFHPSAKSVVPMVHLTLDRWARPMRDADDWAERHRLIFTAKDVVPPTGWVTIAQEGGYALLRRVNKRS